MGGMTNIHHANQVLDYSGREVTIQAQIMPLGKAVFLINRGFTQDEVNTLAEVLRAPHSDVWQEFTSINIKPVSNDKGVPIPAIYISPAMEQESGSSGRLDSAKSGSGVSIELAWVIVVRGASGAMFSKVRVFYSRFAVAAGIMEDVLQGWSVVFSAAMLKRDVRRLGNVGVEFEKVGRFSELVKSVDVERDSNSVLLYC